MMLSYHYATQQQQPLPSLSSITIFLLATLLGPSLHLSNTGASVFVAAIDVDTDVDVMNEHSSNLHDHHDRILDEQQQQQQLDHEPSIGRIIGGTDADVNEYPWFVHLGNCGGSLVAPEFVLTAAHCNIPVLRTVKVGPLCKPYGPSASENCGQKVETFRVVEAFHHPNYEETGYLDNDFTLTRLNGRSTIEPVPMDMGSTSPGYVNGKILYPIGLGTTIQGIWAPPDHLQHVAVPYVDNPTCRTKYGGSIKDSMMCAGDLVDGGEDACQGDSGGPLYDKDAHKVVGITSWGSGCALANKPGVYARISHQFDEWIRPTICIHHSDPKPDYCEGYTSSPTLSPTQQQTTGPTSTPMILEAENADELVDVTFAASHAGYTGTGFIDYITATTAYIQWQYTPSTAGNYELSLRYALGGGSRPLELIVNGEVEGVFSLGSTGGWSSWQYSNSILVYLPKGEVTIRVKATGSSGPNVDHLRFSLESAATVGPSLELSLKPSTKPSSMPTPSAQPPCEDTPGTFTIDFGSKSLKKTCEKFAAHKKFNCKRSEVQAACPDTCGLCPTVPTISPSFRPSPSAGWPCEDTPGDITIDFGKKSLTRTCTKFAAHKKFNCMRVEVKAVCPDTCGLCVPTVPTISPSFRPSPSSGWPCEDPSGKVTIDFGKKVLSKSCVDFAGHKKWNCDKVQVQEACPKSCNLC